MSANKKFKIRITETLSKTIDIEAENFEEAFDQVAGRYKNADIVLSYEDYVDTDFEWVQEEEK